MLAENTRDKCRREISLKPWTTYRILKNHLQFAQAHQKWFVKYAHIIPCCNVLPEENVTHVDMSIFQTCTLVTYG